jgi:hypothetical protein
MNKDRGFMEFGEEKFMTMFFWGKAKIFEDEKSFYVEL